MVAGPLSLMITIASRDHICVEGEYDLKRNDSRADFANNARLRHELWYEIHTGDVCLLEDSYLRS